MKDDFEIHVHAKLWNVGLLSKQITRGGPSRGEGAPNMIKRGKNPHACMHACKCAAFKYITLNRNPLPTHSKTLDQPLYHNYDLSYVHQSFNLLSIHQKTHPQAPPSPPAQSSLILKISDHCTTNNLIEGKSYISPHLVNLNFTRILDIKRYIPWLSILCVYIKPKKFYLIH